MRGYRGLARTLEHTCNSHGLRFGLSARDSDFFEQLLPLLGSLARKESSEVVRVKFRKGVRYDLKELEAKTNEQNPDHQVISNTGGKS